MKIEKTPQNLNVADEILDYYLDVDGAQRPTNPVIYLEEGHLGFASAQSMTGNETILVDASDTGSLELGDGWEPDQGDALIDWLIDNEWPAGRI